MIFIALIYEPDSGEIKGARISSKLVDLLVARKNGKEIYRLESDLEVYHKYREYKVSERGDLERIDIPEMRFWLKDLT